MFAAALSVAPLVTVNARHEPPLLSYEKSSVPVNPLAAVGDVHTRRVTSVLVPRNLVTAPAVQSATTRASALPRIADAPAPCSGAAAFAPPATRPARAPASIIALCFNF